MISRLVQFVPGTNCSGYRARFEWDGAGKLARRGRNMRPTFTGSAWRKKAALLTMVTAQGKASD